MDSVKNSNEIHLLILGSLTKWYTWVQLTIETGDRKSVDTQGRVEGV